MFLLQLPDTYCSLDNTECPDDMALVYTHTQYSTWTGSRVQGHKTLS